MQSNDSTRPGTRRAPMLAAILNVIKTATFTATLTGGLLAAGPGDAFAKQYANVPPPMPEIMRDNRSAPVTVQGAFPIVAEREIVINDKDIRVRETGPGDMGFAIPDLEGGFIWVPSPAKTRAPGYTDAQELRLKIRELASQLIANMDPSLRGTVAIPTSFVNQEDFSQSSPLGRFIAEQFIYECNQRGFPVREYRMAPSVTVREDGEFLLTRKSGSVSTQTRGAVFVVGTYLIDRQTVFVNARLVRGDGMVLRTAQVLLPGTGVTRRMLAGGGRTIKAGTLPILDYKRTTQPTNLTPFDKGEDIH